MNTTERNPFSIAVWIAIGATLVSLILAVARCGPSVVQPVVDVLPTVCGVARDVCVGLASGIEQGAVAERDAALLGCNQGHEWCLYGARRADDAVGTRTAALTAQGDPCADYFDGCVQQGDPDLCSEAADACRSELTP